MLRQRCSWPRGDGTLPHPLQFPLRRGRVIAGEVLRLTVRLLREQGAPWGPESPASALHTSGSARPISPPPGMMPARQRGFYSEVLDAELEPTSQADLKQVRRAPPSSEPRTVAAWLERLPSLAQHRTRRNLSPPWPYGRSRSRARAARACSRTSRLRGRGYHAVRRSPRQPQPKPAPPRQPLPKLPQPRTQPRTQPRMQPRTRPPHRQPTRSLPIATQPRCLRATAPKREPPRPSAPLSCKPPPTATCAAALAAACHPAGCQPPHPHRAAAALSERGLPVPARATAGRACTEARPALPPLTTKSPTTHYPSSRHKRRCTKSARHEG